jgi:hypothetical protein
MDGRKGFSQRLQVMEPRIQPTGKPEKDFRYSRGSMLKSTLILTTLLFLLIAPAPDSRDFAEMSANFLIPDNDSGLLASTEPVQSKQEETLE